MRIVVAAVGRMKQGADRDLLERYLKRMNQTGRSLGLGPLAIVEVAEGRGETAHLRQADEAARILKLTAGIEIMVALDEAGRSMTSREFASFIAQTRDSGANGLALLIGGPDGHGDDVRQKCAVTLALGPMTLPHGLARIVLTEQLYRATTILAGHPYHRD